IDSIAELPWKLTGMLTVLLALVVVVTVLVPASTCGAAEVVDCVGGDPVICVAVAPPTLSTMLSITCSGLAGSTGPSSLPPQLARTMVPTASSARAERCPRIMIVSLDFRPRTLQPLRLAEKPEQIEVDGRHDAQRHGIAVDPIELRHVPEVHAVDARDQCGH